jgi:hypothetical protein
MTLNDELLVIDETIAELEGRRTEIINRMEVSGRPKTTVAAATNLLSFPTPPAVVVTSYRAARHPW